MALNMVLMAPVQPEVGAAGKVSYNFLTQPAVAGMNLWQLLLMFVLLMLGVVCMIVLYYRSRHQKEVIGNILVGWIPETGHEWECLCPIINGIEILPPDEKKYKRLTGGKRPGELPGTYFIGPVRQGERSPITTVQYPRGWPRAMQVQVGHVRFREIDSNPIDPFGQEEIVDPIVVAAKTHRALAELILEATKDQLEVFKNIGKQLAAMKPVPAWVVYVGFILLGILSIAAIVMSNSNSGGVNDKIQLIIDYLRIPTVASE